VKDARPPYIDRKIYQSFKHNVKQRKEGRIRDTLTEEVEKALYFYDKCGKDVHYLDRDEMISHLEGVEWKILVDVDGTKEIDVIEEFKHCFKDVVIIKKTALAGFIATVTGKDGDYTYRKYKEILVHAGFIDYGSTEKAYYTTVKFREATKQDSKKFKEITNPNEEVDEYLGGISHL